MPSTAADFQAMLRAAIAEAKTAGLEAAAAKLEARVFAAYTTSSEWLGETGAAILEFLSSAGPAVPPQADATLHRCLSEIRKTRPGL